MYEILLRASTNKPFQLNPRPESPASTSAASSTAAAKAYLDYGVSRNEGFIVITGEIGAGKTTLLRALIDGLHGSNVVVGHWSPPSWVPKTPCAWSGRPSAFKVKDVPKSELLITLEAFLISQTSKGKRCLLIVDEAQNLTPRAVEELRMLSNFQFGNQALMQSFLVGQPEFREILQRPEMEQFRQRVAATCHIGPLDQDETQHYIEHRLKCAGSTGKPSFERRGLRGHLQGQRRHPAAHQLGVRPPAAGRLPGRQDAPGLITDVERGGEEFAQEAPSRAPPDGGRQHARDPCPAAWRRSADGAGCRPHAA
jgi:general secretion pathway protein A